MKLSETFRRLSGLKRAELPDAEGIDRAGIISEREWRALADSLALYRGEGHASGGSCSLSLAAGISSELAGLTLSEFGCRFPQTAAGRMLQRSLTPFFTRLRSYTEYACASGGVMFKPFYDGKLLSAECVLPFRFLPLAADGAGRIVSCAFFYPHRIADRLYTRIERHLTLPGCYEISNRVLLSEGGGAEREVPLTSVPAWAGLAADLRIEGLSRPLFSYFAIPSGNAEAPRSPLGVPVFRRAEGLIREADRQFGRLLWEFEGGELAVDASEEAFRTGRDGKPELPPGKERLYRSNALDACCSSAPLLSTFSPALRDKSLINGLNRIVMFIEDACGLARGTFSDPSEIARTATEVKSMRHRTYSTVRGIQSALESALLELIGAAGELAQLYGLTEESPVVGLQFGDGVLVDTESRRAADLDALRLGAMTAEEFREKWLSAGQPDRKE